MNATGREISLRKPVAQSGLLVFSICAVQYEFNPPQVWG
jgi:hypothetical protein